MSPPDIRPPLGWRDLSGRRVGLWGMGVEGIANLAEAQRHTSDLVLVDRGRAGDDVDGFEVTGDEDALTGCVVVVKSPGISRRHALVARLEAAGIPVVGGLGLWMAEAPRNRVACVTGTKGKSTTVSVVGQLFAALGVDGAVGGNIGAPPYGRPGPDPSYWCLEVSSYQVTDLAVRPGVVAITSLAPDHLEWHGGVVDYYRDKLSLAGLPGEGVVLASTHGGELSAHTHLLPADTRWIEPDERASALAGRLGLAGLHGQANVAMAIAVVEALTGDPIPPADLDRAANGYRPLASRLTHIASIDGVDFVDDCLSTNTLPTISALAVYRPRPIALIVGGADRGIDYEPLAGVLADIDSPLLLLCLDDPDNGLRIAEAVRRRRPSSNVETRMVGSLEDATRQAFAWCRPHHGVVLLSPAAPTQAHTGQGGGRYPSYKAKAAAFVETISQLRSGGPSVLAT